MSFFSRPSHPKASAAIEGAALLAPTSEEAAWKETAKPKPPRRLLPYLKTGGALCLLALGTFSIAREQGYVSSDNAVVSTRLVSLRAPIDGVATDVIGAVGAPVTKGERLLRIDNPRFNDQPQVELREHLRRLESQKLAAEADRARLRELAAGYAARAAGHAKANAERLDGLAAEAERTLDALATREAQAQADVSRMAPLAARGILSPAAAERLETTLKAARHDLAAQRGRLDALRAESAAARGGVLSSPGGIDVSYSAQRADQVAIEVAHLDRAIADFVAEAKMIETRLASGQRIAGLARSADLDSPVDGMIWRLGASDAERLGAGDMAVQLVDCKAPVLLVAIPQDRFADVRIGAPARFRLAGELNERAGEVVAVTGQGDLADAGHYAALPIKETGPSIIAQVALEPAAAASGGAPEPCLIGRTARALLPTTGGGPLDRLMRRLF